MQQVPLVFIEWFNILIQYKKNIYMLNIEMIKKNLCKPNYFSYGLFFMICQHIYLINLNHLLHFKNQTNLRHMIWCNLLQRNGTMSTWFQISACCCMEPVSAIFFQDLYWFSFVVASLYPGGFTSSTLNGIY